MFKPFRWQSWRAVIAGLFVALAICAPAQARPWVNLYYPGWQYEAGNPKLADVDLRAATHLIFFGFAPNADGTLDDKGLVGGSTKVAAAAHKAGKKVLVCLGGAATGKVFEGAMLPEHIDAFVKNLTDWVQKNNFDGIDLDMEPMPDADTATFQAFTRALRASLKTADPKLLLTAVPGADTNPNIFLPIQDDLDQINVQTYEMSGAWTDWVSWHNGCLYTAGHKFPTGGPLPSTDSVVNKWIAAGITPSKLGIGIDCWGKNWHGLSKPEQDSKGVTVTDVSYRDIITNSYTRKSYHYDVSTGAPWLGLANDFVSYDDPRLVTEKIKYIAAKHIGGIVLWDIGGQYFPGQTPSQPLSDAIYSVLNPPTTAPPAPRNVAAKPGNKQVTVSWKGASGNRYYNVYRGVGKAMKLVADQVVACSYTDAGLTNGKAYTYKVTAVNGKGTSKPSSTATAIPVMPTESAHNGMSASIPGVISFDTYDEGGEGLAYHDTTPFNNGGQFRQDGVDIEPCKDSVGNGYDIAWTADGEWMKYTVEVAQAGIYHVDFRIATDGDVGSFHLEDEHGVGITERVNVVNTHGWQAWENVNAMATLKAGSHVIKLVIDTGGMNLNSMTFTAFRVLPPQ